MKKNKVFAQIQIWYWNDLRKWNKKNQTDGKKYRKNPSYKNKISEIKINEKIRFLLKFRSGTGTT